MRWPRILFISASLGVSFAFYIPLVSRASSNSGLTPATRKSFTSAIETPLSCIAQSSAEDASAAAAAPPRGGPIQRVYKTWRWHGYTINFKVEGKDDSPPVLLIHGFGASVGHFRKNFPVLVDEGYRVYAVDLLGFGASDKPKEVEYSLELWQEILTDFIKEMSLDPTEQWIVMGNSLGGLLTLMLTESLQEGRKASGSH